MKSAKLMAPMRWSILLPMVLGLTACAGAPPIVAPSSACSALLPEAWRNPVPGAPLPGSSASGGDTVGDWIQFGDAQTAQLDKANDRTVTAIGIVERCEARDAEAVKRAKRKSRLFGIF
jgi:hypothetical protein